MSVDGTTPPPAEGSELAAGDVVLDEPLPQRPAWTRLLPGAATSPSLRLLERNLVAWRGMWLIFVSVMVEPIFYLFSIGVGVGALVGNITLSTGQVVSYREFVAAGLLASSAMMGPVFDSTFNFFVKLKYVHTYQAVLATPMGPRHIVTGEMLWSLVRASLYAAAFLVAIVAMALTSSWWALLCVPVSLLIGFAFSGAGLGATTYMRSFIDFDLVNVAIIPLFLFSGTFFPVSQYPTALQWVVQCTPLYQGVALERGLLLGDLDAAMIGHAVYLVVMGAVGLWVGSRRLHRLLLP